MDYYHVISITRDIYRSSARVYKKDILIRRGVMDVYNLSEMWGAVALRGFISILFGLAAVFWPAETLVILVYLFGAYVLVTGLVNVVASLGNMGGAGRSAWGRVALLLLSFLEIGVGVYFLRHPHVAFDTAILLIGLVLVVRGLVDIFAGIFGDVLNTTRTVLIIAGLAAVAVGVIVLLQPISSGIAFVWLLGLYALVTGPILVALAFDAKKALPRRAAR
jgi:uncharacterized membrane protein HdeD (DUF308 family)